MRSEFEIFTIYGTREHFRKAEQDLLARETDRKWFGCYWVKASVNKPIFIAPNGRAYSSLKSAMRTIAPEDTELKYL